MYTLADRRLEVLKKRYPPCLICSKVRHMYMRVDEFTLCSPFCTRQWNGLTAIEQERYLMAKRKGDAC